MSSTYTDPFEARVALEQQYRRRSKVKDLAKAAAATAFDELEADGWPQGDDTSLASKDAIINAVDNALLASDLDTLDPVYMATFTAAIALIITGETS